MAVVSPETVERIRASSDIVEVIGAAVPLKRAGGNYVALCPFHKEKSPSFNVSPQKQIFHCFGCHKGGDVFTFVQEFENISFPEALKRLAERAKIPIEFEGSDGGARRFLKETLLQLHEQIAQRWQHALRNDAAGEIARAYLAKRGVSDEAIRLFRIGYAPAAWDDTVNWATSKKFELATVEQAGLIIRRDDGSGYYDRFRGRLMFPICDEQGRIIAFSGRVLSGDEKTAKYVNSPETPLFTKGKVFYGLDKSKRALLDHECALICEGQLDLIACFMAGVQNVVAPQGTAFTPEHARILKRYVNEVVLCFDSDTAGKAAAVRVLDSLVEAGLAIRVATMPAPHDPDSFIKEQGAPAFQKLIARADGFFDYYLKQLCAENDLQTDKGRLTVLREMGAALAKTGNQVLIDTYAQKTALRLAVTPEAIRTEFRKQNRPARPQTKEEAPAEVASAARPSPHEVWLLKIAFASDDQLDWLRSHLDLSWIEHAGVRQMLRRRIESQASQATPAALLGEIEDHSLRDLLAETIFENRTIPNPAQQLQDIVLRLRNQALDRELQGLLQRVANAELPDDERNQLLQRQMALRQMKREPLGLVAS